MRGLPAAVMSLRFIASPGESVKSRLQHCETSLAVHLLREASPLSCCRASCAETRHVPGLSRVKRGERRTFCSVREHAARALEHERGSCGRQPQAWREPSSHKPLALCLSARSKPPFQGDGGSQRREPMSEQALRARVRAHDLRPRRRTKAPHARDRHGAARRAACRLLREARAERESARCTRRVGRKGAHPRTSGCSHSATSPSFPSTATAPGANAIISPYAE